MFFQVLRPSLISALALAVADIADALVIGNRVGEKGLAAIGIVTPLYMIYNFLGYGFSTGGCVTHGKLTSAGKNYLALCHFRWLAVRALSIGLLIAAIGNWLLLPLLSLLGVNASRPELLAQCEAYARPLVTAAPVFLLNYLLYDFVRCDDDPDLASLGFSLGCGVDLGLNLLLVLVLNMGVTGSILATVTAQAVSVAVLSVHLFNRKGVLRLPEMIRAMADRTEVRKKALDSLSAGCSVSIRYIFILLFLPLGNRLLLRAGDMGVLNGDLYVAVFDVVMNVSYVAMSVYEASSETMQPLASVFSEERDQDSLRYILELAMRWGLALGVALAGLLAVFAPFVSSFFGLSGPEPQAVSVYAIRVYCLSAPFAGALVILAGYYQSVGKKWMSSLITVLRNSLFLLSSTFLLGYFFPARFWWLFPICEALSLLTLALVNQARRRAVPEASLPVFSAVMDNGNHELPLLLGDLEAFCEAQEIPMKKAVQIQLAAEELCLITMEKAFTGNANEYIQVTMYRDDNEDYILRIRNSAPYFNPFLLKTGRLQQDVKEEFLESIGVMLVKKQAKSIFFRNYEGFNVIRVVL